MRLGRSRIETLARLPPRSATAACGRSHARSRIVKCQVLWKALLHRPNGGRRARDVSVCCTPADRMQLVDRDDVMQRFGSRMRALCADQHRRTNDTQLPSTVSRLRKPCNRPIPDPGASSSAARFVHPRDRGTGARRASGRPRPCRDLLPRSHTKNLLRRCSQLFWGRRHNGRGIQCDPAPANGIGSVPPAPSRYE